jgi:tetratricopeptide (TPR) repeat protein
VLEKQARQRAVVAEKLQVELRKEAEAGRAGEALLRQQAEVREKLTQAVILLRDQNHAAADRLVRDLSVIQPTLEGAATFRTLGEWHAHEGRWKEATERFSSLLQVNQLEWQDLPSLDYVRASAAWIELADESGYDVYRKAMIARYAKSQDPISAERTIKCCLIVPGDEALMASLAPLGRVSIDSFEGKSEYSVPQSEAEIMVWRMLSIALMQYRLGQYEVAAAWTRRSLAYPAKVPNRKALAHILLAMSLQQLQPGEQARAELEAGRAILNERFDRVAREGWNHDTHWFDWVIARGHIREADALFSLNQEKVTAE